MKKNQAATAERPALTPLELAIATLEDLSAQHAAAAGRKAKIVTERRTIAFEAHTGSPAAASRLGELNTEEATLAGTIDGLAAAVEEAKSRVQAEEATLAQEAAAARRAEVERLRIELRAHASKADELLAAYVAAAGRIEATVMEMNRLGEVRPSWRSARVGVQNSLLSGLTNTPLSLEHRAPTQRQTLTDLVTVWLGPDQTSQAA